MNKKILFLAICMPVVLFSACSDSDEDNKRSSKPNLSCPNDNHPHAIDLGLPSGTKWCCCNVKASKPEEYGGYYAWGELSEKKVYNWDTYRYGLQDIGSDISGTEFDVAREEMGDSWRMPTEAECRELMENCTWKYVSDSGFFGCVVTSKKNGYSIFIPAAGYRSESTLIGEGRAGYCWASTLNSEIKEGAWHFHYYVSSTYIDCLARCNGHSVRPVW